MHVDIPRIAALTTPSFIGKSIAYAPVKVKTVLPEAVRQEKSVRKALLRMIISRNGTDTGVIQRKIIQSNHAIKLTLLM